MTQPRAILVLRFSSIGDIVQTTSVVGTLKSNFPEAVIDFMTLSKYASLLEGHPHINRVHAVDIGAGFMALKRTGFEMETMGYDLLIDLHNTTRSRIVRKAMVKTPSVWVKKPRWNRFKLFALRQNHFSSDFTVRSWLHDPVRSILPASFEISPTTLTVSDIEKSRVRSFLETKGVSENYCVITPGAAWSQKQWIGERYAAVIDGCIAQLDLTPVLIGGPNDAICELIKNTADSKVVDIHGKTNLRESMAIVGGAQFVMGSDTGLLHAGEALNVPAIAILGPTSRETGASVFNSDSKVVAQTDLKCRPCSQNGSFPCYRKEQYCMTSIYPEAVMDAIHRVVQV